MVHIFSVNSYLDKNYTIVELKDGEANSRVRIAPERGGIVIGFEVQGEEILYLNEATFEDQGANVRGGIPVLFPISGQLENGQYEWKGISYKMKNHGFARNMAWEVLDKGSADGAAVSLRIASNNETKEAYPFDFEVVFIYRLKGNRLEIVQEYSNHSNEPMPVYPGFHPYFKSKDKNLEYGTDAREFFDYNDGKTYEFEGKVDHSNRKESVVFLEAEKQEISFTAGETSRKVTMKYGDEFKYVVLWTEKGQDFVCVEPWMAKTGELNRQEELVMIEPGDTLKTFLEIIIG